jgi:hypothetical protein
MQARAFERRADAPRSVYEEERVSRMTEKRKETVPKDARRERLAERLRANLLKRKAQARARKEGSEKGRKAPTP